MFCPNCGIDEKQPQQFCRACGTNLMPVRAAVETPDSVTSSAMMAREEIGRAMASKIRETQSARELAKVAEDVLPEIEKFLESPEEKRMRRLRTGTIIASIGLGVALSLAFVGIVTSEKDFLFLAGLGGVTFFLGLGFVLNALLFTVPKKTLADHSRAADSQRHLDAVTDDLRLADAPAQSHFASVTESTTRHLDDKQPIEG